MRKIAVFMMGFFMVFSVAATANNISYHKISNADGVCCKMCRKGKACGNSCISRYDVCHKPPGCACDAGG
jgi:hypothetical protein